jgi:phage tail-like protein
MAADNSYQADEKMLAQAHPAFRYVVIFGKDKIGAFTECTLPTIDWEIEEVKEGGMNTRTHQLPGRRKAARLTLKYGVCKDTLWEWYKDVMDETFVRKNITVQLLGVTGTVITGWYIQDAYPVKWTGPQLQTDSTAIAIQTLEFACGEVSFDPPDSSQADGRRN